MNLTAQAIANVVGELTPFLKGRFFNKLFQTFDDEWIIELKKGTEKHWLLVSLSKNNGRIHLVSSAPEQKQELSGFSRTLKKTLARKPLDSICQWKGDRVVIMEFATPSGRIRVIIELIGSTANMFMVDISSNVVAIALDKKSRNSLGGPYIEPGGPKSSDGTAEPDMGSVGGLDFNIELERRYAGAALSEKLESLKTRALSPLRTEKKRITKRLKSLERDEVELIAYENYKNIGDILQANFAQMGRGAKSIELANLFSDDQETITISLDPSLGPRDNIEKYYKRHRKYIKGIPRISADRATQEERLTELAMKVAAIEAASEITDLDQFIEGGVKKQKKSAKKQLPKPSGARRFMTSTGYLALVGRNDLENDEITFRKSNGRDLWLHARDYPGSHVVVKLPKNVDPTNETLKEAAMLALNYSKAAKAGKGEVTYCRAKDIKKPRGAPAGKVLVHGAKSVFVRIDEDKIKAMKQAAEY